MKNYGPFFRNFLSFRIRFSHTLLTRRMSTVYEINFKSCGNLYEKWRKEGKYRKIPKGDIEFRVRYSDTHKNSAENSELPTVVALHGAPGTCEDYSKLSSFLHQNGVRVVVPSFPDFFTHNPGVFRHTADEKAQFVKDFLERLNITQIDTLVVHSSSVYTGLQLCLDNNPLIKSLVMLNPGIHTYKMKSTRGVPFMKLMVLTSEIPILYKVLQICGPPFLQLVRVPVRTDNYMDPLLSCTTMIRANIPESKDKFLHLSKSKLPILYAFSDDDRIIGKECSYSLAQLLGVPESDVFIYNSNGILTQEGKETPLLKVMSFENGSHYVFWKYADIINSEIKSFMAKL